MRTQVRIRTPKRRVIPVASLGLLFAFAARSEALPVTHEFTGTVDFVTTGTPGTIDLTGTFNTSQTLTLSYTAERATPPLIVDANVAIYGGAVTAMTYSIGTYTGGLDPSSVSVLQVGNDVPQEPRRRGIPARPLGTTPDFYGLALDMPDAPNVNGGAPLDFQFYLFDDQGTAWNGTGIPGVLPDMADFESKAWGVTFQNGPNIGIVQGTFDSVSTPVLPASWGRLKSQYRD